MNINMKIARYDNVLSQKKASNKLKVDTDFDNIFTCEFFEFFCFVFSG